MRQATSETRDEPFDDAPVYDHGAVRRNYRLARLRRRHRIERTQRSRHAAVRFWAVLVLLLSLCVFVSLEIWHQIQQLFGL